MIREPIVGWALSHVGTQDHAAPSRSVTVIAGVQSRLVFDQQQQAFLLHHRIVRRAPGHQEHLTFFQLNERDTFRQPFLDTVSNLKRIEVLDKGADPSKVAGLDIKLSDVSVKEDKPSADDIVNIRITADDASTVDGTKLPIGPLLIDEAFGGKVPQTQPSIGNEPVDWRLTTVKRDGRWYLSVFYTIAETARARTDSAKVPAQPVQLNGADTPEHAVDDMLQALSRSDVEGLIGLLNPREFEALQRYAPLFLKDAQKELDSQKIGVRISNTKYTVNGSGNHRSVGIDAFKITANDGNDDVVVELKDDCLTMTRANDSADLCSGGVDGALTQFGVTDNKQVKNFVGAMRDAFAGFKPTGIAVDQVDGKWYISPIGTGADFWVAVLKTLDKNQIVDVIDSTKAMINSFETGDVFNTDASSATTTTTTG